MVGVGFGQLCHSFEAAKLIQLTYCRLILECFFNGLFLSFSDFSQNSNILSPGGYLHSSWTKVQRLGRGKAGHEIPNSNIQEFGAEGIQGRLVISRFYFFEIMFKLKLIYLVVSTLKSS